MCIWPCSARTSKNVKVYSLCVFGLAGRFTVSPHEVGAKVAVVAGAKVVAVAGAKAKVVAKAGESEGKAT